MPVTITDIKALRERTGAGYMDCKRALDATDGNLEQALLALRTKQGQRIEDRGQRVTGEGLIQTYLHPNAKIGVIVEISCETDFVARNDEVITFARDLAMHIAAANPRFLNRQAIDPNELAREQTIFTEQAAKRPAAVREQIIAGQLNKWFSQTVLLDQVHVHTERYQSQTIGTLLDIVRAKTGEHVTIRRFSRFATSD